MSDMLTEPANGYKTIELPTKKTQDRRWLNFFPRFLTETFFNYQMHGTTPKVEMINETPCESKLTRWMNLIRTLVHNK